MGGDTQDTPPPASRGRSFALDDDLLDEAEQEELDAGLGGTVDDSQAVPLTEDEIAEIRGYIDRMARVADSKFDRLRKDIDAARGAGHSTIVFTQFTDTLDDLRDKLLGAYRSQLATFTGDGGRIFREAEGWAGDLQARPGRGHQVAAGHRPARHRRGQRGTQPASRAAT